MRKDLHNSQAAIPICLVLLLLGILSLIASASTLLIQHFHFMESGHNITVPNDPLPLSVQPDTAYALYHRLTGTHITENNPSTPLPDDLQITLIETETNTPLELVSTNWYTQSSFFGFRSKRRAIYQFTTPSTESVTLQVANLDNPTVFYLGPTHRVFNETRVPYFIAWGLTSIALIFLAAFFIIRKIVIDTPDLTFEEPR